MVSRSRWLVGSSSSSSSLGTNNARARFRRMRQPPDRVATGCSLICSEKPSPASSSFTRACELASPAASSCSWPSAMAIPSPSACARASPSRSLASSMSAASTNSQAATADDGIACSRRTMRIGGSSISPESTTASPTIAASSVDLPLPLGPTRATRSPVPIVASARSSSTLPPRASVTARSRIIGCGACVRASGVPVRQPAVRE